jgi:uncharacterized protein (TIGR02145 family)
MKKIIINLFAGLMILFTGCTEEAVTIEQPINEIKGKVISVKAGMPGENQKTRLALDQNELDVILTWEVNDVIYLVFDDGTNTIQQTSTVTAVSNGGRTAEFEIEIPQEIIDGESTTFNLYGLYGGVTFSEIEGEEGIVELTTAPWSGAFLQLEQNDIVLIRFAETGIDKNSPSISVNFQHVGSLFKIYIDNTGAFDLEGITSVELFSDSPIYAYQNASDEEGAKYDLISGTFVGGTTFSNVLPFNVDPEGILYVGDALQLWGWYSPSQNEEDIWPALNLRINYGEGQQFTTVVPKPARTATTDIGKAYHFFSRFDASLDPALAFTNIVNGIILDERDGQIYSTVRIGDQIWMAENLRYFPGFPDPTSVNLPEDGSTTEPRYYAYGYYGPETLDIAIANFVNYGILYNWPAAMQGEESSSSNPSGVQGVCPDGWHLPSEAEWVQLTDFVRTPELNDAANKLKETGDTYWISPSPGTTNEFGFNARGGGARQGSDDYYFNLRILGHWLTSTEADGGLQFRAVWMQQDSPSGGFNQGNKDFAGSVRCVKD